MSRETIARALKRLREQSNLTADQVGLLVGKSGKTVNAWENNRGQPDAEMLIKLCDIYHVDDILAEFREDVRENPLSLSDSEKSLIIAYRKHPEMQSAVNTLLGISAETPHQIYRAARSTDHHEPTIQARSASDMEKLINAPKVTSDDDL